MFALWIKSTREEEAHKPMGQVGHLIIFTRLIDDFADSHPLIYLAVSSSFVLRYIEPA